MLGFMLSEVRKNTMLDFMITKLGYRLEQFNPDALVVMNGFHLAPGIMDKLPDNLITNPPVCGSEYAPCDISCR